MNRRTLGRGLSALLGSQGEGEETIEFQDVPSSEPAGEIPLAQVDPNPFQPRTDFDPAELDSLADSIKIHGLLQPVVVREAGDRYQLVAGERRFRAAQTLGLQTIPARIVKLTDQQTCELALVENLQRKDLNAIEKALAFQRYLDQFQSTHETLANQLGVDRSTVTNLLRLLDLPDAVQEMVVRGELSNGHARAVLSLEDPIAQLTLANDVISQGLTVRQTEAEARKRKDNPTPEPSAEQSETPASEKSNHVVSIEGELCQKLGTKVVIQSKGEKGQIVIHFASNDDFERALEQLRR